MSADFFKFAKVKTRRGRMTSVVRSASQWKQALNGHTKTAHDGKELKECRACQELRKRVGEG